VVVAIFFIWLGQLLTGVLGIDAAYAYSDSPKHLIAGKQVARTLAETRFIHMNFGVVYEPRKLSKREKLALELTAIQTGSENQSK